MEWVIARVLAGVASVPRVGRSARRCHSPGSGGANRLESSAGAMLGIPPSRRHVDGLLLAGPAGTIVGRSNKVSSGPLAWVMIHRHHAAAPDGRDSDHNAWVSFGKQDWVNSRERRSEESVRSRVGTLIVVMFPLLSTTIRVSPDVSERNTRVKRPLASVTA